MWIMSMHGIYCTSIDIPNGYHPAKWSWTSTCEIFLFTKCVLQPLENLPKPKRLHEISYLEILVKCGLWISITVQYNDNCVYQWKVTSCNVKVLRSLNIFSVRPLTWKLGFWSSRQTMLQFNVHLDWDFQMRNAIEVWKVYKRMLVVS